MAVCYECGSPDVVSYTKGGRRYYHPYCRDHWGKYCYRIWKRARIRKKMGYVAPAPVQPVRQPDMRAEHRRQAILAFLREYRHRHGRAPTQREIATGLNVSLATVSRYVALMRRDGVLARADRVTWRGLQEQKSA